MKVLFTSGREPAYNRTRVLLNGLKKNKVDFIDLTVDHKSMIIRNIKTIFKVLLNKNKYDVVFVGFFGQPLMPFIKLMTNKPILFDVYISSYETMCYDRRIFKPNSLIGRFYYYLDYFTCKMADMVMIDTNAHIDYFIKTFRLKKNKFRKLLIGSDDDVFYPKKQKKSGKFKVFHYCAFRPLHGVEEIVKAGKFLGKYKDIEIEIAGNGLLFEKIKKMIKDLNIKNVKLLDYIEYESLSEKIVNSDVCLGGHYGDSPKAYMVISAKEYDFLAMGKPTIVGNNKANKELLKHNYDCLMVPHKNPKALADAVLKLYKNPKLKEKISKNGYKTFSKYCTPKTIGKEFQKFLKETSLLS